MCHDVSGYGHHCRKGVRKVEKRLMKGNEALAEGAIRAGCRGFFGYPITPSSEIAEYMARELPKVGGVFLQGESEVASINMVYGAAATGKRVMTASSSPGISLKQEGLSYIAKAELPCLIVNISRGGPGLGAIQAGQSDYFQATKGGGHGDYHLIVLAPSSVQEMMDFTMESFELAEKYRIPVMVMADGTMGQMMEPIIMRETVEEIPVKPWALTGCKGREKNVIDTFHSSGEELEKYDQILARKHQVISDSEKRGEAYQTEDAEIVVVAFGLMARIVKKSVDLARKQGIKAGMFRPITLWPFPYEMLDEASHAAQQILSVELNQGQMVEDVKLAVNGRVPVSFYGRISVLPSPEEILQQIVAFVRKEKGSYANGI